MKLKFLYLFILVLTITKGVCQTSISSSEYSVFNDLLRQVFVQRGFETENLPKEHTALHINELTFNRLLGTPKNEYLEALSDTFYTAFEKLNEQKYKLSVKKIKTKVNSKFKRFDIDFSRCYIEKDYAIVYLGILFAPLNAEGAVYVLKKNKSSGNWEIIKKMRKWVS